MPRPLLYFLPGSPPARAVMMLADIIGLELDIKEIDFLKLEHKSEAFLKLNPMGTIPTLQDGDFVISESHTIMKYLLEKYGGDKRELLYPSDIRTRALIDQCVFFETGVFFVRLKVVVLPAIFEGHPGPTPKHIADIEEAYGVVEAYLGNKPYLVGNHLTLADLSLGATTTAMEVIHKVDPKRCMVLVSPTADEYELLRKQLLERLESGNGEIIYDIGHGEDGRGLTEDEYSASLATLQSLVSAERVSCVELRRWQCGTGLTGQYLLRMEVDDTDFMEIRVAVVGNVDAGKSTLLGVLTHGELDNGRGYARQRLFRHKHEMESGRTSSVGNDILGFDSLGNVVNKPDHGTLDWVKICEKSSKVITFIDLAGHERYLKTTVFGMTGHAPDFGMLMIGANAGIVGMTKEHLGLALALSVPVFVVVTKIDMCPPNVLQDNLKLLIRILKSSGCRKVPVMVKTKDDVIVSATNFVSQRLCPIFQVSNVTGENLELLTMFLNLLKTRMPSQDDKPAEFQIDDTYSVPGVGTVVSGTTLAGVIRLNDTLLLGPDPLGRFTPIAVKSIHRKRMPVPEVRGGQTASFALKKIKRSQIRKGMVMVSPALNPQACWQFEGEILVLHHPTTISSRYQAMVHCGSIRQTASILSMSRDCLRTGDKALVRFRFIKHPEYLKRGQRMVFREGRTKAVGNVLRPEPAAFKPPPRAAQPRDRRAQLTLASHAAAGPQPPLSQLQESDVTAAESPFEVQADKRGAGAGGGGGGGGGARRGRKRHDKPSEQPAVVAN